MSYVSKLTFFHMLSFLSGFMVVMTVRGTNVLMALQNLHN